MKFIFLIVVVALGAAAAKDMKYAFMENELPETFIEAELTGPEAPKGTAVIVEARVRFLLHKNC